MLITIGCIKRHLLVSDNVIISRAKIFSVHEVNIHVCVTLVVLIFCSF